MERLVEHRIVSDLILLFEGIGYAWKRGNCVKNDICLHVNRCLI